MDTLDSPQTRRQTAPLPAPLRLQITALGGIGLVRPGDDLARIVMDAVAATGETLMDGDVLVVAQKIVSKVEDRYANLDDVTPSPRAVELARKCDKDPRLVELILSESTDVVRYHKGVLVVAHRLGLVLANAGIDSSNVEPLPGADPDAGVENPRVLLLPVDPDASCRGLREKLYEATGRRVAIIVNDSLGRAWRSGTMGAAIGASGIEALVDLRGRTDLYGRPLLTTQIGQADEIAAAASLVMGQADEGRPVVLVRGLAAEMSPDADSESGAARDLVRPADRDLFR
jgi:coenzyme F420-0:L-glutamate ligase/coenzyme F420-1:gamma-L-glutamate ligase